MELIQINFKCYSVLNHVKATLIICTSEVNQTHAHMVFKEQTMAITTWLIQKTCGV